MAGRSPSRLLHKIKMLGRVTRISRRFGILVKSYVKGSDYPPLPDHTISRQIEISAQKFPDSLAVASYAQERYLTYRQLFEKAVTVAANLIDSGVQRGDRIVVLLPQCVEFYVIQLACTLSDTILVSLNVGASPAELSERLNVCRATVLVTSNFDDGLGLFQKAVALRDSQRSLPGDQRILNVINNMKKIYVFGLKKDPEDTIFASFERMLFGRDPSVKSVNTVKSIIMYQNAGSTTLVSYTSGATGRSKGVALSHYNLMNNAVNFATEIKFSNQEKILLMVPLYTTFGICLGNLAALSVGATIIYPAYHKDPKKVIQATNKFDPTFIIGAAMNYLSLIEESKGAGPMRSISRGILGGSICTESLVRDISEKLKVKNLTVCYGMTETSSACFMTRLFDSKEKKLQTVGTILNHLEAKVVDDEGVTVDVGTIGELMVKGYSVFNCYYNNQEMTKQNLVNGWVRSGDLAIMENDGYVRIIGHKKNVIIRAGENIYSEDIEVVLAGEPDFKELKAVGVPDEIFGEEVALYYVPAHSDVDLNLPALAERLASRLKRYQLPRYIIRVAEIPRTFNGKIQSFKLREDFLRLEPQELQKIEIKYEQPPH